VLQEKDTTPAELKRELREMLLVRKYLRDHVFSRVAVTDAEIEAYLNDHAEMHIVPEQVRALQILVKTEEQAKQVVDELKKNTTFEDAAMKYSLSPEAKSGGDLGFFARGAMPAVFDEVCFNTPVNQVSKIVSSDYGFHLFKVIERRPQAERPMEEVRDKVEAILRRDKEAAAQRAKLDELRKATKITIQEETLAKAQ
jgi:peptidyl-prolyl cis-trans isomerase C